MNIAQLADNIPDCETLVELLNYFASEYEIGNTQVSGALAECAREIQEATGITR